MLIRPAQLSDATAMLAIYAPVVRSTAISFELEPPTLVEFEERVRMCSASWVWLVAELRGQVVGYAYGNAYAGIALPNPASVALHESVGFRSIGTFPEVGRKFDRWHDVGWFHCPLRSEPPVGDHGVA